MASKSNADNISTCISIAMCSDNRGVPMMHMALKSIFDSNRDEELDINIITDGFSQENRQKLDTLAAAFNRHISIHTITQQDIDKLDLPILKTSRWNKSAAYRFLLQELLPNLNRVLYLDIDIIVRRSLMQIWTYDLGDYVLGAVTEVNCSKDVERIGIVDNADLGYINSGVMLINLGLWRQMDLSAKLIKAMDNNADTYLYPDQDAINQRLWNDIKRLPMTFNVQYNYFTFSNRKEIFPGQLQVLANPVIIHFSRPEKPWHKGTYNKWFKRELILRYCNMEPHTEGLMDSVRYEPQKAKSTFSQRLLLIYLKAGSFVKQRLIRMHIFLAPSWKLQTYDPFPDA